MTKDPVCRAKNCGHQAFLHNGDSGCGGMVADEHGSIVNPCPCKLMPEDVNKPRKRPALLTPKSRHVLEARGYTVERVEQVIPGCFIRRDFGGFADLIAFRGRMVLEEFPNACILAVQVCAGSGHAAHKAKIVAEKRALTWLQAGGHILLQSWAIQGAKGKRKRYELREEEVTLQMFEEAK